MTSNYRNSEGTDLDNLFRVTNSNLGAIGFKTSNGADLGNRYSSGSLGYNVGLKNSAGTDLGYLRGNREVAIVNITVGKGSNLGYYGYSPNAYGSASPSIIFNSNFRLYCWDSMNFDISMSFRYSTFTITRLDSMLSSTITTNQKDTDNMCHGYSSEGNFFTSRDLGKTITVRIEKH